MKPILSITAALLFVVSSLLAVGGQKTPAAPSDLTPSGSAEAAGDHAARANVSAEPATESTGRGNVGQSESQILRPVSPTDLSESSSVQAPAGENAPSDLSELLPVEALPGEVAPSDLSELPSLEAIPAEDAASKSRPPAEQEARDPTLPGPGLPPAPTPKYVGSQHVFVSWAENGDAVWGFSKSIGRWTKQEIQPAAEDELVPIVGGSVAGLQVGHAVYAYSGQTGRWDILRLPADRKPKMSVDADMVVVTDGHSIYTFANSTGQWSSPDGASPETSMAGESSGELRVFSFKHVDARSVFSILRELFGELSMAVDQRQNVIYANGAPAELDKLEAVARQLDQPVKQLGQPHPSPVDFLRALRKDARANAQPQLAVLRDNYNQCEQQAARLAEQYRDLPLKATRTPGDAEGLKQRLTEVVNLSFEARQQLQRAELAQLRQRLALIEQQIATRDRIKDAIVGRRVEELLNTDLQWEPATTVGDAGEAHGPGLRQGAQALPRVGVRRPAENPSTAVVWIEGFVEESLADGRSQPRAVYMNGTMVSPDGLVAVVLKQGGDASELLKSPRVYLDDLRAVEGRLVAYDPEFGAGLMKVDATDLPFLALASEPVAVNEQLSLQKMNMSSRRQKDRWECGVRVDKAECQINNTDGFFTIHHSPNIDFISEEHAGAALVSTSGQLKGILGRHTRANRSPEAEPEVPGYWAVPAHVIGRLMEKYRAESPNAEPQPEASSHDQGSPGADSTLDLIRDLEAYLERLRQKYGPQHPTVKDLETQLQALQDAKHATGKGWPTAAAAPSLILRSAGEFGRKLNEAEAELKQVIQHQEKGFADAASVEFTRRNLAVIREEYAAQIRLLELELQEAETAAEAAAKRHERLIPLFKPGPVPPPELVDAQCEVDVARLRVERLRTLLYLYRKVGQTEQPQLEPVEDRVR